MPIGISLQLRDDLDNSEVDASGFNLTVIDDDHAHLFGIPRQVVGRGYNKELWDCIRNWWGRPPDEFVTADPVPGAKIRDGWTPYKDLLDESLMVRVQQKAVGCRLLETTGSVDAIVSANVRNYNDKIQPGQEAELNYSEDVSDTRYCENSLGLSLMNGFKITAGGEYAGFKAEGERYVEFTVSTSTTSGKSTTVTKGRSVRLKANVDAEPRSIYPVSVMAGQGTLKLQIDYEYSLTGHFLAIYEQRKFRGKLHAPPSNINELLDALGKPRVVRGNEILDVGFVTSGDISIGKRQPLS